MSSAPLIEKFSLDADYPYVMTGKIDNDDNEGLIAWEGKVEVDTDTENTIGYYYEYESGTNNITTAMYEDDTYYIPISIGFSDNCPIPTNWYLKGDVLLGETPFTDVTLPITNVVVDDNHWVTCLISLKNVVEALDPETLLSSFTELSLSNIKVFDSTDSEITAGTGTIPNILIYTE